MAVNIEVIDICSMVNRQLFSARSCQRLPLQSAKNTYPFIHEFPKNALESHRRLPCHVRLAS